jgi:hypothetical protein
MHFLPAQYGISYKEKIEQKLQQLNLVRVTYLKADVNTFFAGEKYL